MIGPDYNKTRALILNNNFGSVSLEYSKWSYFNYTQFIKDDSLAITGKGSFEKKKSHC